MERTKKPTIEEYWRELALPWEGSSYDGTTSKLGFVERMATFGRQHIHHRKETALEILRPFVKGNAFLDIGCAGGIFETEILRQGAAEVTGVDVSPEAVQAAQRRAQAAQVERRAHFYVGTIDQYREYAKRSFDIVVGLGILEYLKPELARDVLMFVKPKGVLFSFDEKEYTFKKGVHYVYRVVKRMPYYKKFTAKEIAALLAECGYSSVQFKREHANSFVYSLPAELRHS